ncbi:histidyl-tRNA synthetase [Trametes versicolor FP-101664 SS1]|uniref:histidyl-tRNA synthetase n=1 Tax=Trametes versicolor (strain FP-101664) TaxID=717944 RepID=UPI000462398F|nr:histidyl-tRNA synthetase [Trametes versicolor FP-101664 SS1]EIW63907.1 histidyl-tRNA synthetase [Trametes versicolor FP-101664 SS1]
MASSTQPQASALADEIAAQSSLLNDLRKQQADPAVVEEAKKKLGDLKRSLALQQNANGGAKDGKKKERILLKTAKVHHSAYCYSDLSRWWYGMQGTRDYGPGEMFCREHIERIVKDCFTTYGGSQLDTPVFERKEVLAGKYGEDAKLIFDLMDQGGEQLALRYDHTVPLARYLAMNGAITTQNKLWQVGKVYRRDNPVMSKGRMREFSQADFDIAGAWDTMIPDAEVISVVCSILSRLDVGEFTIKMNHRKILDGIFEVCGVPADKIRPISSAVDKLDKMSWADVKKEMTEEKGLDPASADKIGEYVKHKGGPELLDILKADEALMANANAKAGVDEMVILFTYLKSFNVLSLISFDLSLARGLDYYTGIIYEAIVEASAPPGFKAANAFASSSTTPSTSSTAPPAAQQPPKKKAAKKAASPDEEEEIDESQVGVGSIAAGGRYDNLVGMFTAAAAGEGKKAPGLPCVGVSIGLDRIFALVWPKWAERGMRSKETMAYVMAAGDGLLAERVELVRELREAGIKTDFLFKAKPKLPAQFAAGEKDEVPFAIILGGDELKEGLVTVKEQKWEFVDGKKVKVASSDKGTKVKRAELIQWLKDTSTFQDWSSGKLIA